MSLLGGLLQGVKDVVPGPLLGDTHPIGNLLQGVKDVLPIPLLGDSRPIATAAPAPAPKETPTTSTVSVSTSPPATSSAPVPEPTTTTSKSSPPPASASPVPTVSTSTLSTSSVSVGSHAESATGARSMTKSDSHGLPHTFSSSASLVRSTSVATNVKTQSDSSSKSSMSTGFIIFLACAGFILLWILVMGMVLRRRRHRMNSERAREVQTEMSGMVGFGKLDDGPPSPPTFLQRPRQNTIDWIAESNGFQFATPHGVDPNASMYHSNLGYDEKHSDLGDFSRVEMMGMQEYPPPPPPPKMYHEQGIGIGMQPRSNNQIGVAVGNAPPLYIPDVGLERARGAQSNRDYPDPHYVQQDQSIIRADQPEPSFPESMSQDAHWNQPEPASWTAHELSFPETPSAVHSSHLDSSAHQRFSTGLGYLYPIRDSISEHSGSQQSGVTRTSVSGSEAQSELFDHILPSFTPVELGSGPVDRPDYIRSRSASEDTIGPSLMPLPGA
ncbi:hypothetical protein DFH28DRAFT_1001972 [Melampsora americana]|nr:hypothetical protein DFH28DRAFT_1001972 [Melampsora americana]